MTARTARDAGLRYEVSGDGPELVLVHELGGSLESFDGLMPLLTPFFRILRYDQRGAGGSGPARAAMTIEDHAAELAHLVDVVGFSAIRSIVGVAAGAAIAVAYSIQSRAPSSLVLCAPALSVPPERKAYLQARSDLARREGMAAVVDASLARSYPDALRGDHAAFEAYRARFLSNDPESYAQANMALAATRVAEALPKLSVPCLVIAGWHDLLRPPAEVAATAADIPGARFEVIESGHLMPVQAPRDMADHILDFVLPQALQRPASETSHA
ncbi:alpha/beta hydrolase [Aquabacter sp. CN5-332]|uniref:alpha/beta fold hydrolase n=1 Tax=Aquabacter sp. CN5-332 TaxID=3156608 RepID=UPI0032B5649C